MKKSLNSITFKTLKNTLIEIELEEGIYPLKKIKELLKEQYGFDSNKIKISVNRNDKNILNDNVQINVNQYKNFEPYYIRNFKYIPIKIYEDEKENESDSSDSSNKENQNNNNENNNNNNINNDNNNNNNNNNNKYNNNNNKNTNKKPSDFEMSEEFKKKIEEIVDFLGCSKEKAFKALKESKGDIDIAVNILLNEI